MLPEWNPLNLLIIQWHVFNPMAIPVAVWPLSIIDPTSIWVMCILYAVHCICMYILLCMVYRVQYFIFPCILQYMYIHTTICLFYMTYYIICSYNIIYVAHYTIFRLYVFYSCVYRYISIYIYIYIKLSLIYTAIVIS